jgi:hypothetical protein
MAKKMKKYASFDEYLADQPAKHRAIIRALRALVKGAAPELQEAVKWGNGCWVRPASEAHSLSPGERAGVRVRPVARAKRIGGRIPGAGAVCYVYSAPDHVQFGFILGSKLKDPRPRMLLEGSGAYVRHIKLRSVKEIDEKAFAALVKQAARL